MARVTGPVGKMPETFDIVVESFRLSVTRTARPLRRNVPDNLLRAREYTYGDPSGNGQKARTDETTKRIGRRWPENINTMAENVVKPIRS